MLPLFSLTLGCGRFWELFSYILDPLLLLLSIRRGLI